MAISTRGAGRSYPTYIIGHYNPPVRIIDPVSHHTRYQQKVRAFKKDKLLNEIMIRRKCPHFERTAMAAI